MSDPGKLGGFTRDDNFAETDKGTNQDSYNNTPRRGIPGRPIRILLYTVLGIVGVVVLFGMLGGGNPAARMIFST